MLAINPTELFRSGTQLSFLCVAALATYGSRVQQSRQPDPLTRLIRETRPVAVRVGQWVMHNFIHSAFASLAIWLAVAPLIAYHFHLASPISILVTPLLWPLVAAL